MTTSPTKMLPVSPANAGADAGPPVDQDRPIEAINAAPTEVVLPTPARAITGRPRGKQKRTFVDRVEAYISKLSTKNNFWHRACSLIWLPFAFRSGIKMKRIDQKTFTAVLPFRRFNRNWYNAMAGAALLGNSEIAGGMYVFGVAGGDYTVVCKNLSYTFLRPCFGPAVYRIKPREDIHELLAHGGEFNITIDLEIYQGITKISPGKQSEREKRVGRCEATFHVTPKLHQKGKRERRQVVAGEGSGESAGALPAAGGGVVDQPPPT